MADSHPKKREFLGYDRICLRSPWKGVSSLLPLPAMLSERHADSVRVWTPAKVNLFLEVLGKRPDGYHDIATLMVAVDLHDLLEFKEDVSGRVRLHCDHATLSTGPDNLVCRAAELLRQKTGCSRGAEVRLHKRIPLAAGLAGGSSDAAATLAVLNHLWDLNYPPVQLAEWAADLGSDISFFFSTPAAWCTGRGEQVRPLELPRQLSFVLACLPVGLATADVYGGVTVPAQPESGEEIRRAVAAGDVEEIGRRLHNRLQEIAEKLCPAVSDVYGRLRALNPAGCLMSGSGTSVFALCRDGHEAVRIVRELRTGAEEGLHVFLVHSCH